MIMGLVGFFVMYFILESGSLGLLPLVPLREQASVVLMIQELLSQDKILLEMMNTIEYIHACDSVTTLGINHQRPFIWTGQPIC